jgi:hypothetical protein
MGVPSPQPSCFRSSREAAASESRDLTAALLPQPGRFESLGAIPVLGLDRDQAIRRAAVETGIDPQKVRWCSETAFADSTIRLSRSNKRRRGALARAAAL